MKSLAASAVALLVVLVISILGLLISTALFGSQLATVGGNTVMLVFALFALVAGTFTYKQLTRTK